MSREGSIRGLSLLKTWGVIELAVLVLGEVRLHATAKSMWSSTKCSPSRGGDEVRLGVI